MNNNKINAGPLLKETIDLLAQDASNLFQTLLKMRQLSALKAEQIIQNEPEVVDGSVNMSCDEFFILQTASASGLALKAKDYLANKKTLDALIFALAGQRALYSVSTSLLGIELSEGSAALQKFRSNMAREGAKAKLVNDPKQAAKAQVKECWLAWRKKPETYKGKSAFAKDMMEKYESLDSQVVITRWCSQWEKETGK